MQTSADHRSRRRHVSHMTDEKDETNWSPSGMSKVRSRPESGGRLFHARTAVTGKARSPRVARRVNCTCSVVVSACQHGVSGVGCRLSDRYACAMPCTQWYARTYNRNWIRSTMCIMLIETVVLYFICILCSYCCLLGVLNLLMNDCLVFDVYSVKRMYNVKVGTGKNTWCSVKLTDMMMMMMTTTTTTTTF